MAPDTSGDDAGDQVSDGATDGGGRDSGSCNALVNAGAPVSATLVAAAPPAAGGGTVADGTYVLVKYQVYTGPGGQSGPTGSSLASTLALAGGTYQAVSLTSGSTGEIRVNGAYATNGTKYTATTTCPGGAPTVVDYTADPTTLTQYGATGANTLEFTYAKR
jgi:hypothetical protein